jgi:thiosulfate/3-mercaptopyruvate sulfurtransferase
MHPLISAKELLPSIQSASTVIFDCRHDLIERNLGRQAWQAGHIPSAVFFDIETDGAGAHTGTNGRHPLPTRDWARDRFERLGLRDGMHLVVYDASGGMYAARVWWMARWLGFANVQLLDGGIGAWVANGGQLLGPALAPTSKAPGRLTVRPSLVKWIDATQLDLLMRSHAVSLVDARAPARYRGETEPMDPVAGHIPGALNRFYQDNLTADGVFKSAAQLRDEFSNLVPSGDNALVHQCGSGVTACHNLIAQQVAGLGNGLLYPGSWSEWCAQPGAPVATGASAGTYPRASAAA